jgi:hypothetical protein
MLLSFQDSSVLTAYTWDPGYWYHMLACYMWIHSIPTAQVCQLLLSVMGL